MGLDKGTRLGAYEILAPLGAGGMGEVYKAHDTRLDRTVAIKILPEHLSAHAERQKRFEREAKTISQLSHPNICVLFDVGREGDVHFLVMEHLEGETLSDRLRKGALSLEQTLELGAQIARGLDYAHRAGIVHRDLKPANVMLTKTGVKLLDFGLAKPFGEDAADAGSDAPTRAQELTGDNAVLGTLPYMAPEQLEGKSADARSDIWALGAVLYEMLTGVRAFRGESQASLISAIMSGAPKPVSELRQLTPPALDLLVSACLEKDPDERWQSAADVAKQLSSMPQRTSSPVPEPRRRIGPWAWPIASAVLAGILVYLVIPKPKAPSPLHVDLAFPAGVTANMNTGQGHSFAISRDGQKIVFAASDGETTRLYLREMSTSETRVLSGTEGAREPFFSPNAQWIGFRAGGELRKIAVDGGVPVAICRWRGALSGGASWTDPETIVLSYDLSGPLYRVPAAGGDPEPLTALDDDERGHNYPTALPDGKHIVLRAKTR